MSELATKVFRSETTKLNRSHPKKKVCQYKHSCNKCNESKMFFDESSKRFCYEDKYNIPTNPQDMKYKYMGMPMTVATGVIEQGDTESHAGNNEIKLKSLQYEKNNDYMYLVEKTCKRAGYSFDRFMKYLKIVSKEEKITV